ncbi:hypothetical protein PFISCL1PPCAC_10450, partial [Pristionchus fissidentatus]
LYVSRMDQSSSDASRPSLQQRLHQLTDVEKSIDVLLKNAQFCLNELAKEKQVGKSKMDEASANFRNALNFVESTLSSNMAYLSNVCVGTPHQGSTFAAHHKMALAAQCEQSLHSELASLTKAHFPKDERVGADDDQWMETTQLSIENSSGNTSILNSSG